MIFKRPNAESAELPVEFDPDFYRGQHGDLQTLDDAAAAAHFDASGKTAGLRGTRFCSRGDFIQLIDVDRPTLEIGPFTNPVLRGPNVRYFDVLKREALIAKAAKHGHPCSDPVRIDFVSPTGDLGVVKGRFDQIFSSHCIEHQPDLVRHLQQVSERLNENGRLFLIIPDKRYCFDHYLPESTLSDVLGAYLDKRRLHAASNVIDFYLLGTHNDAAAHWAGDHGGPRIQHGLTVLESAFAAHKAAGKSYLDAHAGKFTPDTFRALTSAIHALGLTDMRPARVYNTPRDQFEFCAILTKS